MSLHRFHGIRPTDRLGRHGLLNPERGLRLEVSVGRLATDRYPEIYLQDFMRVQGGRYSDYHWIWQAEQYRADGVSVVQAYCYLDRYLDGEIPRVALDAIQRSFDAAREAGLKFLLRFAYGHDDNGFACPELPRLLAHMDQLAPLLQRNADVLYVLQCGFLGAWGEFHSSANGMDKRVECTSAVVRKTLEILPDGGFTQMRRGDYRKRDLEALGSFEDLDARIAFSSRPAARIGFFNDATLANHWDAGTWVEPPHGQPGCPEFDRVTAEAPFMPVDGELFWTGAIAQRNGDGIYCAERLRLHHYTTFSYVHSYSQLDKQHGVPHTIDDWKAWPVSEAALRARRLPVSDGYFTGAGETPVVVRTAFEYIRDHLGYRLELQEAGWPDEATAGGEFSVSCALVNRGFSTPIKRRDPWFLLFNAAGETVEVPSGGQAQSWQPYEPGDDGYAPLTHRLSATVRLPAAMTAGEWHVALWLPDSEESLRLRPAYAIRLANRDTRWQEVGGRGCNVMGRFLVTRQG